MWNVLRWVLAALVAGFIGQFGRSFAQHLLRRRKKKREAERVPAESREQQVIPPEVQLERERLAAAVKIAKKQSKADAKRRKKERDD